MRGEQFHRPAANQETVLAAFQEEGWPDHIDDPLRPSGEHVPRHRLGFTVRRLNDCQTERLIRFFADGTGHGICWERLSAVGVRLGPSSEIRLRGVALASSSRSFFFLSLNCSCSIARALLSDRSHIVCRQIGRPVLPCGRVRPARFPRRFFCRGIHARYCRQDRARDAFCGGSSFPDGLPVSSGPRWNSAFLAHETCRELRYPGHETQTVGTSGRAKKQDHAAGGKSPGNIWAAALAARIPGRSPLAGCRP